MRHLDLCSGIGGFALAARWMGWETVQFVEIDDWCQKILAKNFPGVPIHGDIETYEPTGPVSLITAGYPCQPFSHAGKRGGAEDDRHIWPEVRRVVSEAKPAQCVFENVAGHITLGLDEVLSDLEGIGYACQTYVIPACAVDAPHRRDRVWIVANARGRRLSGAQARKDQQPGRTETIGAGDAAHTHGGRVRQQPEQRTECEGPTVPELNGASQPVADPARVQQGRKEQQPERERTGEGGQSELVADTEKLAKRTGLCEIEPGDDRRRRPGDGSFPGSGAEQGQWLPEPGVGRVAHGIPQRVDRLRGLGNAIVPQVAHELFRTMEL